MTADDSTHTMIRLWPWQHREFVRRCTRYALLLGLLQVVLLVSLIQLRVELGGPVPVVMILNRPMTVWDLWLIQVAGWSCAGAMFFWLGVRVICPKCLARLTRKRRHALYYCPACDEYLDDGTMERLAQQPMAAPPALHQKGREWNRMNCLARIGRPETIPSANKAFPVPPGPGPCSR